MCIGFEIAFLVATVLEISPFSLKKQIAIATSGHETTGSSNQCVHWIERGQVSGYRF